MMATILRLEYFSDNSTMTVTDIERENCGLGMVEGSYGAANATMVSVYHSQ